MQTLTHGDREPNVVRRRSDPTLRVGCFYLAVFILVLGSLVWGLGQGRFLTRSLGKHVWLLFALVGICSVYAVVFPLLHRGTGIAADLHDVSPEDADTVLRLAMAPDTKVLYWVESPGQAAFHRLDRWSTDMHAQGSNAGITTADGDGQIHMRFKGFQEGTRGITYRVCGDGGVLSDSVHVSFDDEMFQSGNKNAICANSTLRSVDVGTAAETLKTQLQVFQKQFVGQLSTASFDNTKNMVSFQTTDPSDYIAGTALQNLTKPNIVEDLSAIDSATIQSTLDTLTTKYFNTATFTNSLYYALAETYRKYARRVLTEFNTYMTSNVLEYRQFMTSDSLTAFNYWFDGSPTQYVTDLGTIDNTPTPTDYDTCKTLLNTFIPIVNTVTGHNTTVTNDISNNDSTYADRLLEVNRARIQLNTFKKLIDQTSGAILTFVDAAKRSLSYKASFTDGSTNPLTDLTNNTWTDIADYTTTTVSSDETTLAGNITTARATEIKKKYYSLNFMLRLYAYRILDNTIRTFLNTVRTNTQKQPMLTDALNAYHAYSNMPESGFTSATALAERQTIFRDEYPLIPTLPTLSIENGAESVTINGFIFNMNNKTLTLPSGEIFYISATTTYRTNSDQLYLNSLNAFRAFDTETTYGWQSYTLTSSAYETVQIIFPTYVYISKIEIKQGTAKFDKVDISYDPTDNSTTTAVVNNNYSTVIQTGAVAGAATIAASTTITLPSIIYTRNIRLRFIVESGSSRAPRVTGIQCFGTYANAMPLKTSLEDTTTSNLTTFVPPGAVTNASLKSLFLPNRMYRCMSDPYSATSIPIYKNTVEADNAKYVENAYSIATIPADAFNSDKTLTAVDGYFIAKSTSTLATLQSLYEKYATTLPTNVSSTPALPLNTIYKHPNLKYFIDFFMGNANIATTSITPSDATPSAIITTCKNMFQFLPTTPASSTRIVRRFMDTAQILTPSATISGNTATLGSLNYFMQKDITGLTMDNFKTVCISFYYNGTGLETAGNLCQLASFYLQYTSDTAYRRISINLENSSGALRISIVYTVMSGSESKYTISFTRSGSSPVLTTGYHHLSASFTGITSSAISFTTSNVSTTFDGESTGWTQTTSGTAITDATGLVNANFKAIDIGSSVRTASVLPAQTSIGIAWIHIYNIAMDSTNVDCDVSYDLPFTTPNWQGSEGTNTTITGSTGTVAINGVSKDQCKRYCAVNTDCRGFVHNNTGSTSACTLHAGESLALGSTLTAGYTSQLKGLPT